MKEPRIAFFDLENSPTLGYYYDRWKEGNIVADKSNWYLLSFAVKWSNEKQVRTYALPDYKGYRKNKEDDEALVKDLWRVFDEADVLVAHNCDLFDTKKARARFLVHGLDPPSPYKTIDTLKMARRIAKFNSNKLDDLGLYLHVGRKIPTTGTDLWLKCMQGDLDAWKKMRAYNAQDVVLLEKVYLKLRAWDSGHPNLNLIHGRPDACPTCQGTRIQARGRQYSYTLGHSIQHYRCMNCGKDIKGERVKLDFPVKFR